MGRFKLMHKHVLELENFLKDTKDKIEHTRALAVLNRHRDMAAEHAAESLNVTTVAVFKWCRMYKENGKDGLRRRKPSGRTPVVKNMAKQILEQQILKELDFYLYSRPR